MTKLSRLMAAMAFGGALVIGTTTANALSLNDSNRCSLNNATNGIMISDVTGNMGGATDCWGTESGNDPGPGGTISITGSGITGSLDFDFLAKIDDDGLEGANIGLDVQVLGATSGTWSYDPTLASFTSFLIVLKAANDPGYAVWLFNNGSDAASWMGEWEVAWGNDLSHITIYGVNEVPLPAAGFLLLGRARWAGLFCPAAPQGVL